MKPTFILILLCGLMGSAFCQQSTSDTGSIDAGNYSGILELFEGVPLYHNRSYYIEQGYNEHIPLNEAEKLEIIKSEDGKSVTISQGSWLRVTLYKTKTPGVFRHSEGFRYRISKYSYRGKVQSVRVLDNGAIQIDVEDREPVVLDIAGIGLKLSSPSTIKYYETEQEHLKSSRDNFEKPRIISLGETVNAWDNVFRFAAIEGSSIRIRAVNHRKNIGNAYVTLYGVNGEVVKHNEGKSGLNITYKIPEDGFYYISTRKDDLGFIKITLTEE